MTTKSFAPRGDRQSIEEGETFQPKFTAEGLIPVVTTSAADGEVLMQAWMNAEAIRKTLETGEAHYWSRSRAELWRKGATSGEIQKVVELRTDCDQDALWLVVEQQGGGCCHVGYPSCFYRRVISSEGRLEFVLEKTKG
jgi:phosphoribosyl-AMP cyclohydrolase